MQAALSDAYLSSYSIIRNIENVVYQRAVFQSVNACCCIAHFDPSAGVLLDQAIAQDAGKIHRDPTTITPDTQIS